MNRLSTTHYPSGEVRRSSRARRREETLARLLRIIRRRLEAGEIFTDLAVEDLAAEAGISRTTFYVYFEDKGDVLRAWFGAVTEEMREAAARWWALQPPFSRADLHRALAGIVATYRPHTALMSATHDAVASDLSTRDRVEQAWNVYVEGLRDHIEAGQSAGFVDPTLPPAETAYWLQWMAERGLHQIPLDVDPIRLEALVEAYTAIVWNTLYRPVDPASRRATDHV